MADDALRDDLANSADPAKGAALVGYRGRTAFDRLSDELSVRDFYSQFPDWETDATNLLNTFFNYVAENPKQCVLALEPNTVYTVTGLLNSQPGMQLDGQGATISFNRTDNSLNQQLTIRAGATVRNIKFTVTTGHQIMRFIALLDDVTMENFTIDSDDEQTHIYHEVNNYLGCLILRGHRVSLRNFRINNWGTPIMFYSVNTQWEDAEISNFVMNHYKKGIVTGGGIRTRIHDGMFHLKSTDASTNPGNNAISGGLGDHSSIDNIYIHETGEHAIYLSRGEETQATGLSIKNVLVNKCGQCGLKLRWQNDVSISGYSVLDCAYNNSTGTNEDGLRLENCDRVDVNGYSVKTKDSPRSCYNGAIISGCNNVYINGFSVDKPLSDGIRIVANSRESSGIYINGLSVLRSGAGAVRVDSLEAGYNISEVYISGMLIVNPTAAAITINTLGGASGNFSFSGQYVGSAAYLDDQSGLIPISVNFTRGNISSYGRQEKTAFLDSSAYSTGESTTGSLGVIRLTNSFAPDESGSYAGAISFSGFGIASGRRKAAIAAKQMTESGNNVGIAFQSTTSTTTSTDVVYDTAVAYGNAFLPGVDGSRNLGSASYRWNTIYAVTGTINTSDARLKTEITPFTATEISCAKALAREIGWYKWLDRVAEKGDSARKHFGMTVQCAIKVFESYGLDPLEYGAICHDTYDAIPEIKKKDAETGTEIVMQEARPAGDVYSFRWEELSAFIMRGIVAAQDNFESRLAVLETK